MHSRFSISLHTSLLHALYLLYFHFLIFCCFRFIIGVISTFQVSFDRFSSYALLFYFHILFAMMPRLAAAHFDIYTFIYLSSCHLAALKISPPLMLLQLSYDIADMTASEALSGHFTFSPQKCQPALTFSELRSWYFSATKYFHYHYQIS